MPTLQALKRRLKQKMVLPSHCCERENTRLSRIRSTIRGAIPEGIVCVGSGVDLCGNGNDSNRWQLTIVCKVVPQASTIPRSFDVLGQDVPHFSKSTLNSVGGSTLPQWQNWRSLRQKVHLRNSLKDLPESSKHETSFSTCFYTSNHTDSIASIEMDAFSHKKMRWEWIRMIVAS